jgi:hypothetical protein
LAKTSLALQASQQWGISCTSITLSATVFCDSIRGAFQHRLSNYVD